jgi:hypothetical protein
MNSTGEHMRRVVENDCLKFPAYPRKKFSIDLLVVPADQLDCFKR